MLHDDRIGKKADAKDRRHVDVSFEKALTDYKHALGDPLPAVYQTIDRKQVLDEIERLAACQLEGDDAIDLNTTYNFALCACVPCTAHPKVIYLLVTLGFQIENYGFVMGQWTVEAKYRGLPIQVIAEITDAPIATSLLSPGSEHKLDGKDAKENEAPEAQKNDVPDKDRLYHVEMELTQRAWHWSWSKLATVPGISNLIQVD